MQAIAISVSIKDKRLYNTSLQIVKSPGRRKEILMNVADGVENHEGL
jgi:hypothetical protein